VSRGDVKITITGDKSKLQSALKGAEGDLGGFESKVGSWSTKLAAIAAAAALAFGAAFVGVGAGLFQLGSEFDAAYDTIRVGTGATGDTLAGLKDDLKAVVSDVPTDFETAGTAIADLNTRLGLSGEPLQELATQFLNLSRITGTDLKANVDGITRVFGDWGVETDRQSATLDKLFRASQASGIGLDVLQSSLVQFGAPLRNLGFGLDESMALLAQFNKTGVNTETVFAGLKAGVGKLAKAGEDVPTTFRRVVNEIEALGPGSEATGKAIELFGQRAGPDLADAIAGGKFEVDAMLSAIAGGTDTIAKASEDTASFGEKFQILKNKVLVGLEPIATKVFTAIGDAVARITPHVERLVAEWLPRLESGFAAASSTIGNVASVVLPALVSGATAAVDVFRKVADFASRNAEVLKVVGAAIAGAAVAFGALLIGYKLVKMFQAAKAAVIAFNIALAANPIVLIALAIGALVGLIAALYFKFEGVRNVVDAVGRFFRDNLLPVLTTVGKFIAESFVAGLQTLADVWSSVLWPALQAVGGWIASTLWPIIKRIAGFIGDVFMLHVRTLATIWSTVLWPALQAVGGWIASTLWPIIQRIAGFIGGVFVSHVQNLVRIWSTVLWPALQRVGAFISGTLVPIIQRIASIFASVASSVAQRVGSIVGAVLSIGGRIGGYVSGMWNGITGGIRTASSVVSNMVGSIVNAIRSIGGRIGDVAAMIRSPFDAAFGAIKRVWNSTVGGFGFTVPSWIPGVGGKGFRIPNMHVGGVVPGMAGDEQLTLLEAGETVRTRQQEARLQSIISGLAHGAVAASQPSPTVVVNITGPVARDSRRWIMDELEAAVAAGMRAPRLKAALST
jgi:phage-related protein